MQYTYSSYASPLSRILPSAELNAFVRSACEGKPLLLPGERHKFRDLSCEPEALDAVLTRHGCKIKVFHEFDGGNGECLTQWLPAQLYRAHEAGGVVKLTGVDRALPEVRALCREVKLLLGAQLDVEVALYMSSRQATIPLEMRHRGLLVFQIRGSSNWHHSGSHKPPRSTSESLAPSERCDTASTSQIIKVGGLLYIPPGSTSSCRVEGESTVLVLSVIHRTPSESIRDVLDIRLDGELDIQRGVPPRRPLNSSNREEAENYVRRGLDLVLAVAEGLRISDLHLYFVESARSVSVAAPAGATASLRHEATLTPSGMFPLCYTRDRCGPEEVLRLIGVGSRVDLPVGAEKLVDWIASRDSFRAADACMGPNLGRLSWDVVEVFLSQLIDAGILEESSRDDNN